QHAEQILAKLMAEARGLTMKIGQLMAGSDDSNLFQPLVTSIKPLPLEKMLPILQQHIGKPVTQLFQHIDESKAAASLGQVHHAKLLDDTEVAVKIRYPGIVESINAELKLSGWLPDAGPVKRWQFDSSDYKNTLRRQLLRETDYRIEIQTQQRFKQKLQVPGLVIPKIHADLGGEAVLVQSWEQGCRFTEACKWPKKARLEIARTLLLTLFQSLFVHGEIHGDPHPGNYLFRRDAQDHAETVLLDYGCTVVISKPYRLALLKLIHASQAGIAVDPLQCFVAMGFNAEKLHHIKDKMPALCQILFQPFLAEKPVHAKQWQISQPMQQLLEDQRWWFRAAGPADLLLLLRTFHGLKQQMEHLDVAIPWWPLLKFAVGEELLQQAQATELAVIDKSSTNQQAVKISARKLCIRVTDHGKLSINLDLPAEAILDLESMIPSKVLQQIQHNTDINLIELTNNIQGNGIIPQVVYTSEVSDKYYKIWLE
ncbi:MAG: ABC transporter, partial [Methylococcales bacterium]|nr:ABC transporter [Methylococcales bacterium]